MIKTGRHNAASVLRHQTAGR